MLRYTLQVGTPYSIRDILRKLSHCCTANGIQTNGFFTMFFIVSANGEEYGNYSVGRVYFLVLK